MWFSMDQYHRAPRPRVPHPGSRCQTHMPSRHHGPPLGAEAAAAMRDGEPARVAKPRGVWSIWSSDAGGADDVPGRCRGRRLPPELPTRPCLQLPTRPCLQLPASDAYSSRQRALTGGDGAQGSSWRLLNKSSDSLGLNLCLRSLSTLVTPRVRSVIFMTPGMQMLPLQRYLERFSVLMCLPSSL